jgi:hypothetical protein
MIQCATVEHSNSAGADLGQLNKACIYRLLRCVWLPDLGPSQASIMQLQSCLVAWVGPACGSQNGGQGYIAGDAQTLHFS